ncbi:hypothetical protein [Microbaculum marinum]|uniref:Serine protease n=1 Tax=Microbaculum marinum TaxID=1764581 RepID=A0AAW9REU9_9HYPH
MSRFLRTLAYTCLLASGGALLGSHSADAQSAGFKSAVGAPGHKLESTAAGEPSDTVRSPMPLVDPSVFEGTAAKAPGLPMDGAAGASNAPDASSPEAYGGSSAVYTTARVAVTSLGNSKNVKMTPVTSAPYRATGKIYARWGNDWYVCTASLVGKSVLITAAHCVFFYGEGANGWADEVQWIPANYSANRNKGPYGLYKAKDLIVPTPYVEGTDTCHPSAPGVVCNNDIAAIVLNKRKKKFAGNIVGWYGYGWNGYSYNNSEFLNNMNVVQVTQLGYPLAFDGGYQMQRTDSVGWFIKDGQLKGTQIGSAQTGGSSGGPWMANFGTVPDVNPNGASLGNQAAPNTVIGVTSYGSTQVGYNYQGASYFGTNKEYPKNNYGGYGAGNIGAVMEFTCKKYKKYC